MRNTGLDEAQAGIKIAGRNTNNLRYADAAAAAAKSHQLGPTLCDPIDGRPPGSSVPGILQARTLEWVAISFSSAWKWKVHESEVTHSCLTLIDPMNCSPPGSSVHGIFQSRILEWVAVACSRCADDTILTAESEELKSLLMKVKEESENVGLKLNI